MLTSDETKYLEEFSKCPNEQCYCSPYTLLRLLSDKIEGMPDKISYLDADIMFDEIFCYNWSEDELIANIGMLLSAGYPKEKINELEDKWNESQKEREAEENGE